jgi:thioredoxin-related protein
MKIRLFGSYDCPNCIDVFRLIKTAKIELEYIDAFEDKNQSICDEYEVDELPHIQFIDDNDEVIIQHIGSVDDDQFAQYVIDYLPNH